MADPKKTTASPSDVSAKAVDAAKLLFPTLGGASASKKSDVISGVSRGQDAQGNPIKTVIYPAGFQESYIKNLDPKSRAALQKQMKALNLYPKYFTQLGDGTVTAEDFNALL
jgi:hypothetical protein